MTTNPHFFNPNSIRMYYYYYYYYHHYYYCYYHYHLEVEQGTFTPLVFTTTGGLAIECKRFHSRLAELIAIKKGEEYSTTMSWIRSKVSFALLRSALLCLRGSRSPRRVPLNLEHCDLEIEKEQAGFRD